MKKVLIIVSGVCFGGAELFAINISRYAPRDEFTFDYLTFEGFKNDFAPEIENRGDKVITFPSIHTSGYGKYIKSLTKLIKDNKYDVVHSHTQFNSGINVWVAKKCGVPVRIAHSHTTAHENKVSVIRKIYENFMRGLICNSATSLCACGVEAGKWGFGKHKFTVINNGIDTEKFKYSSENRGKIRKQYGIPDEAFVIGHSGTLSTLKNQEMLIRILPDNAYLMLVGRSNDGFDGYLKEVAEKCGVLNRVIFTGAVINVNEHLSAFDVFAFPSLREGTPLALIEAQANGLPCIISDAIPKDAQITDLVTALPLNDETWKEHLSKSIRENPEMYADKVAKLGYGIYSAVEPLYEIYRGK